MVSARELPITLAAIVSLGAVALALIVGMDVGEQAGLAARWTARVGLPIFLIAYSASSLVRLWPTDLWKSVLRHRRQWGLAFAFTHSVHLVALIAALEINNETRPLQVYLAAGGAYALMYLMALTSSDASQKALGVWWKRLHTLGIHWIWFIFAFSYFGRVMDPERMTQGVAGFALCMGALGLRIAAWAAAKRRRVSASPA